MKTRNLNVNISQYSWVFQLVCWGPGKSEPVRMMRSSNQFLSFATSRAWNYTNNELWKFLKKDDIERQLCFEDSVDNQRIFVDILRKDF